MFLAWLYGRSCSMLNLVIIPCCKHLLFSQGHCWSYWHWLSRSHQRTQHLPLPEKKPHPSPGHLVNSPQHMTHRKQGQVYSICGSESIDILPCAKSMVEGCLPGIVRVSVVVVQGLVGLFSHQNCWQDTKDHDEYDIGGLCHFYNKFATFCVRDECR